MWRQASLPAELRRAGSAAATPVATVRLLTLCIAWLLRRCASANELASFVIAKAPWRRRQSTGAIDQLDRHVASLLAMTIGKWFIAPITERLGVRPRSRNDSEESPLVPQLSLDSPKMLYRDLNRPHLVTA
jgi:hypothetical protein